MSETSSDSVDMVTVPAMAIYAASRLAEREGRNDDSAKLVEILDRIPVSKVGTQLLEAAQSGMSDAIVPFRRHPCDVRMACSLIHGAMRKQAARLWSDEAIVEAGYFEVENRRVSYVDRCRPAAPEPAVELMPGSQVEELLRSLSRLDDAPPLAIVPAEGQHFLRLTGLSVGLVVRVEAPVLASLRLLSPARRGANNGIRREMGDSRLRCLPSGDYVLDMPKAEQIMQIHAAGMAGLSMCVGSGQLRLLMQAPQPTDGDWQGPVRVDPAGAFRAALGVEDMPACAVDRATAVDMCRRHRWFAPTDLDEWVSLAEEALTTTDTA